MEQRSDCFHILRDICSLLVSMVLIWLYTQAICASNAHVCSEVSTLHNQIILELSNWKKGHYVWSNQCFMAHFLSCDLILLVSVKVAFDLANLWITPQIFLFTFVGISIYEVYNLERSPKVHYKSLLHLDFFLCCGHWNKLAHVCFLLASMFKWCNHIKIYSFKDVLIKWHYMLKLWSEKTLQLLLA